MIKITGEYIHTIRYIEMTVTISRIIYVLLFF